MPKLLFFLPCQQVIVNEEDKLLTLVSILERLNVQIPPDIPLAEEIAIPLNWSGVAMWRANTEEIGKTFEQRLQIIHANGKIGWEVILPLQVTDVSLRSTIRVEGFPIGPPGDTLLKLSVREARTDGTNNRWQPAGNYPLIIAHGSAPTPSPSESK